MGLFYDESAHKTDFFLMGLFYGLTPVHNEKAKLSTRSGWHQILLVFGIKDINSHIKVLNLTSANYYQVKHFENTDPVFQKQE